MKKFFLPSLFTILLISCDPHVYNIEIDNSGLKKEIVFDCGKVDISANIIGYSQVCIFQKIKPIYPISINPNELKAPYKNQILTTTISLNGNIIKNAMSFSEESTINIVINHLKINNGDTIKLNIDKFIACKGEILQISDINLIATNKK
ncbi:hypothetical protein [Porphyromonas gingivalis]|uniref:hypothetical protein n=1 Tax=Porphyromonas gingivalis TaxID=837 RepID=UPI00097E016E|nr:hypothetical protein [Porphyromonas gingivalis]